MALQPVLKVLSVSDNADKITVADATGNYEATANPGGFGAPNPTQAAIVAVLIQLNSFRVPNVYTSLAIADTVNLFNDLIGVSLLPAQFGLGTSFPDAVYDLKYNLAYAMADVTVTPGAVTFQIAGADVLFANAVGFILPGIDSKKVWYIDRTKTLDANGGSVIEAFPQDVVALQPAQQVYEGSLTLLVNKAGNNCLIQDIAAWSEYNCEDKNFRNIWDRYKMKVAMEVKFSRRLLLDAHRLAVRLADYCTSNTSCGC